MGFAEYKTAMEQRWQDACGTAESVPVTEGEERGYPFELWLQSCHYKDEARRPEITWFKAIKGNDSFYVVQKAFHFEPSKEQVEQWMAYLRGIVVCDSRLESSPCPPAD